jgi:dipeptidyl aminopeptidase/acylaminoacyl peptidase
MKFNLPLIFLLTLTMANSSFAQDSGGSSVDLSTLKTVAESSDFKATSTSAQVVQFVDACASSAAHVQTFKFGKTVQDRDMIGVVVSKEAYELGQQDERNVVLILGNIHSGECAGKEAILQMLRELSLNPDSKWLEKNVLIFVPNYNADANDHVGIGNRANQIGPEAGMGRRANLQQLDLNRDFMKIESPEGRALVALIDKTNPHLFVDCHTTNGSKHRYALTYDIPHNPAAPLAVRKFLREKMMPTITSRLEEAGTSTFYYGNFNQEHTKWTTFGHEPRYSTEYVGLRGRLAILSEAYAYITYRQRIEATYAFLNATLDYATESADTIHKMLAEVQQEFIEKAAVEPDRIEFSLAAAAEAFPEKFELKGYKDGEPNDYQCDFIGDYKPTRTTPLPYAWILQQDQPRVIDRLLRHGVQVESLTSEKKVRVEFDTVVNVLRSNSDFQKHKMVRIETERALKDETFAKGCYVVRSAQPLGRLAAYLLEPESDDGFVTWNFFDSHIQKGESFPVMRIPTPADLKTVNVDSVSKKLPIDLDMIDGPSSLFSNSTRKPRWFGDTNMLTDQYYGREIVVDCETNAIMKPTAPFSKAQFAASLESIELTDEVRSRLVDAKPKNATNGKVAVVTAADYSVVFFVQAEESMLIGNPENQAELTVFNSAENQLAFVNDDGLNFLDLDSKTKTTVAKENKDNLVGKLDWVYQEELYGRGNFKGFWWHPKENRVAFLSLDEGPVLPFTVMDHLPVRGNSEFTNYPKAGDPLPKVKLGIVETDKPDQVKWVDLNAYDDELLISRVSWSQSGDRLVAQVQNREQTWLDFFTTDPSGESGKAIFRDQTPAWIESPGDPIFVDDETFLWVSPRSGYRHLYRYKLDGTLDRQLTDGEWEIRDLIGMDAARKFCFFTSAKESPVEMHLYRLELATGELKKLTEKAGYHQINFNSDREFYLDTFSDFNSMAVTSLHRNDGTEIRKLAQSSDDRFDFVEVAKPKMITIDTGGQPIDGMLILPSDFDESKKYPMLVHMYAGPQAPRVKNRFGGQWYLWHQMLAQKGYVVFVVDNRSCSHRSAKEAWPAFRNFAENELADILLSIDHLKDQGWVDEDRIGIWGWSYGGYMTAYAMTHSDAFKMGISGAPVTDWKNYDAIYTERYMGLPQDNAEGYKKSSVLEVADQLSGKMLLIHGTIDDNVHLNNSMQLIEKLQKAGKQFELMLYPANRHSVRNKEQLKHLRKLMTDFVFENL